MKKVDTSKLYIGIVEEVIRDIEGSPTLDLRIRIPTIHGTSGNNGLAKEQLPIAKPMLVPGVVVDKAVLDLIDETYRVYVIFEFGSPKNPVYFGLYGASGLYKDAGDLTGGDTFITGVIIKYGSTPPDDMDIGDLWIDTND